MVDVIMRDVTSSKAYDGNMPLLTQKDAEEAVKEHLSKRLGKQYRGEIEIFSVGKKVQVSLNSDMHLVVRIFPEIEYAYTDENGDRVTATLAAQDTDTVVVFDARETRAIINLVKYRISAY